MEYLLEHDPGSGQWSEEMRTSDAERASEIYDERRKNFPHSRWRLSEVKVVKFSDRIGLPQP